MQTKYNIGDNIWFISIGTVFSYGPRLQVRAAVVKSVRCTEPQLEYVATDLDGVPVTLAEDNIFDNKEGATIGAIKLAEGQIAHWQNELKTLKEQENGQVR